MFGHSVIIFFFFKPKKWVFCNFRTGFFLFCFNTDNHRHLFTFFFNCNARKYGENSSWRRKLMKIVFCFLFASFFQTQIHKHSRSLLYNCWRRIEEGFSSFFFFLQEKLEKRWNSVGFSSVNIVDFFLWISSGCSSAFKVVHTSRGAEPWPNQPGTSSHSFLNESWL